MTVANHCHLRGLRPGGSPAVFALLEERSPSCSGFGWCGGAVIYPQWELGLSVTVLPAVNSKSQDSRSPRQPAAPPPPPRAEPVAISEKVAKSVPPPLTPILRPHHPCAEARSRLARPYPAVPPLRGRTGRALLAPFRVALRSTVDEGSEPIPPSERIRNKITHPTASDRALRAIAACTTLLSTGTGREDESSSLPRVQSLCALSTGGRPPGSRRSILPMTRSRRPALLSRGALRGTGVPVGTTSGEPGAEASVGPPVPGSSARRLHCRGEQRSAGRSGETGLHPTRGLPGRHADASKQPPTSLTNSGSWGAGCKAAQAGHRARLAGARLDYLVFDEAPVHGRLGAETACLIRRLRSFCNVDSGHTR